MKLIRQWREANSPVGIAATGRDDARAEQTEASPRGCVLLRTHLKWVVLSVQSFSSKSGLMALGFRIL